MLFVYYPFKRKWWSWMQAQVKVETAQQVITSKQKITLLIMTTLLLVVFYFLSNVLTLLVSVIALLFFIGMLHKLAAILLSRLPIKGGNVYVDNKLLTYAREECAKDNALSFTFLVTLFNEGNRKVLKNLVRAIYTLEYDKSKIQVLFVIPDKDKVTEATLQDIGIGTKRKYQYMSIYRSPATKTGEPQTKPRDLNYALREAKGDMICIFDAEDQPHQQQLLAVMGAALQYPAVQAFQCELRYTNVDENVSTRLAAVSYAAYFNYVLPGYVLMNWALPFGGTSNYFRKSAIETIGGWDGHNITEDANAGILFKLFDFAAVMLFNVETIERPNNGKLFSSVAKQWTRWQAGFLVTMLVQLRHPMQMIRLLGPLGALHVFALGMTPVFGALLPIQLVLTILRFIPVEAVSQYVAQAMEPTLLISWFSVIVGNLLFIITFLLGGKKVKLPWHKTIQIILTMYIFSVVVGFRAVKRALINPHFWGKTTH